MDNIWKILFAGDVIIENIPKKNFVTPGFARIIQEHDLASCNFEDPVYTENLKPFPKAFSPHLYQHQNAAQIVRDAGFNVISMATNHIYDYGQESLKANLDAFDGLITVGAGLDFESAYELKTTVIKGTKIGFLSFCEAESGVLTDENLNRGGFAWINHPSVNNRIKAAKDIVDVLIIQPHAGLERTDIPLPEIRQRYREFVELGADAVIAHHPHIPQGWELYNEKPIFYSIGHFYFEYIKKHELWDKAIAVSLTFEGTQMLEMKVIPIEKTEYGVDFYDDPDFSRHLEYLCRILEPDKYLELANKQALEMWEKRYSLLYTQSIGVLAGNPVGRMLNKFFWKFGNKIFKNKYTINKHLIDNLSLLHVIRVDSHRWSVQRALTLLEEKANHKT